MHKTLSNPLRVGMLDTLAQGQATAPQLAERFHKPLSLISYHTGVLCESCCIQLADPASEPVADQRVFELAPLASSGDLLRLRLPEAVRDLASASILWTIIERGIEALEGDRLRGCDDSHLSCMSVTLDRRGRREVKDAVEDAARRAAAAHGASRARLASSGSEGIGATVAIATFESPEAAERATRR